MIMIANSLALKARRPAVSSIIPTVPNVIGEWDMADQSMGATIVPDRSGLGNNVTLNTNVVRNALSITRLNTSAAANSPSVPLTLRQQETMIIVINMPTSSENGIAFYDGFSRVGIGIGGTSADGNPGDYFVGVSDGVAWYQFASIGTGPMVLMVRWRRTLADAFKNNTMLVGGRGVGINALASNPSNNVIVTGARAITFPLYYVIQIDRSISNAEQTLIFQTLQSLMASRGVII